MIGYSLGFCIQDILSGKVKEKDVILIETGTKLNTFSEWESMLCVYSASYWSANPEKARKIVARMRDRNAIHQPRLYGDGTITSIVDGHWSDNDRTERI